MSQLSYNELISREDIPGAYPFNGYGSRTSIGPETNFAVWPDGEYTIPPAAGVQMSIVSTSANDTAAGTGARIIEMHYLDSKLNPKEEYITLNGITPVLSVATDVRFIQSLHLHVVGSGKKAAGIITASNGGVTYSQINVGDVRDDSAMQMVPANKRLFVLGGIAGSVSGTASAASQIHLVASRLDDHSYNDPLVLIPFATVAVQDNSASFNIPCMKSFPAGTVVGAIHTSDKACTVAVTWFGRIEGES